jgi:hypothetical protein
VLALLERQTIELVADILRPLDLFTLERKHRALLVQPYQVGPVTIERRVVVFHERLRQAIGIHLVRNKVPAAETLYQSPVPFPLFLPLCLPPSLLAARSCVRLRASTQIACVSKKMSKIEF